MGKGKEDGRSIAAIKANLPCPTNFPIIHVHSFHPRIRHYHPHWNWNYFFVDIIHIFGRDRDYI
jgi:hypothetical protein